MLLDTSFSLLALQQRLATPKLVNILVSAGTLTDKRRLRASIKKLAALGVKIFATTGTHRFLAEHGVGSHQMFRISEKRSPNIRSFLKRDRFHMVVNIKTGDARYDENSDASVIRSEAIESGIPLVTDTETAVQTLHRLVEGIKEQRFVFRHGDSSRPSDLKGRLLAAIHHGGGFDVAHAHADKAHVITLANLALSHALMEEKWKLFDDIKKGAAYSFTGLVERMSRVVEVMIAQGARQLTTFIDADPVVKLRPMKAALEVRRRYAGKINLLFATQPLHGVINPRALRYYSEACEMADIIGALPSKDAPQPEKHLDIVMRIARKQKKDLHVHTDQQNNPHEHESELLAYKTIEHGLQGRVWAVHAISLAAQPLHEQDRVIALLKKAKIGVIICPSAALSMKPHADKTAVVHNSIAPLLKLLGAGIPVRLGPDNIADIFQPFVDGDMWTELRLLMEACRFYDPEILAKIACGKLRY